MIRQLGIAIGATCLAVVAASVARGDNRVLIIGIDGAGGSYTQNANMPNLGALVANGAARYDWLNEGALYANPPEGYGASGVNWSTITTGASAAHHGVIDNSFLGDRYDAYPHFFKYIKESDPSLFTASIVDWAPINNEILADEYADLEIGGISDDAVRDAAVNLLQTGDPAAMFLHFDQVDHAGHTSGWGTDPYTAALQNVDGLIGNVMSALNARPGVIGGAESWLVIVTSDHGGQGTSHFASQGPINWQTPFVISGDAVPNGATLQQGTLRDVVPTALWHMGIDPFGTPVDGKVVGLPFGPPNGILGDLNQDGVVAGNGQGPANSDDVTAFIQGWLTRNHPSVLESYGKGDLNLDRVTDLKDWIILNRLDPAMGQAVLTSLSVPEPATAAMGLAIGVAGFGWRRRVGRARLPPSRTLTRAESSVAPGSAGASPSRVLTLSLVLGLLTVMAQSASAALTDSLAGLYEFESDFLDTSGSPQASDGTPVNSPQFVVGKIGQAMWLPGVRDYMSLNPATLTELNFGTTTDFSVSMWVRQDDSLSDPAVFSNKDWDDGNNPGVNWAVNGNGIFDLNTKTTTGSRLDLDTAANSASLDVGAWSHVLITVDRDGPTKLYINGINTGTINLSSQGTFNAGLPWNVGQDGTGEYGVEFTGAVDELAIWRRSLTAGEAGQLWNGGVGINLGDQLLDSQLRLVIDRTTGEMTIKNNTGAAQPIVGYQITSAAGTLNRGPWTPITGRLDDAGNGTIDADDHWVVLTAANSVSDLSEASLGAGLIPNGSAINLGTGVWSKYYQDFDDIEFLYADGVGDEPLTGLVEFIGNGGASYARGDLDFDGDLDSEDWTTLAGNFGGSLADQSKAGRYRRGDLNDDGAHTLDDVQQFRLDYDMANGAGAFAAMVQGVPEPTGLVLLAMGLVALAGHSRLLRSVQHGKLALAACGALAATAADCRATLLFQQNFDGVALGANVDEPLEGTNVWSNAPPAGWSIDNSGVPLGGVTEWRGWALTDPTWWATAAGDQGRSQFVKGTGVVAVADPDEWDDVARDPGTYNSFLRTATIALTGAGAGAARLQFDSSWMPEENQTATVTVSYNGGADVEALHWASDGGSPNFKAANTNETVVVPLNNPAGATSATIEFGMSNAGNNWWWAVDNLMVYTPLTLQVDVQTGSLKLLGDASVALTGYEIASPSGSLNGASWKAGNLDAQNVGTPTPATADFIGADGVNAADLAAWKAAFGASTVGDADDDGDSDGADFLSWQRQLGLMSDPASTWLTFLGSDQQLIESYLLGSSTFASDVSLGAGYDAAQDARDLTFTYTTLAGEKTTGFISYVNSPGVAAVPEPTGAMLCSVLLTAVVRRSHRKTGGRGIDSSRGGRDGQGGHVDDLAISTKAQGIERAADDLRTSLGCAAAGRAATLGGTEVTLPRNEPARVSCPADIRHRSEARGRFQQRFSAGGVGQAFSLTADRLFKAVKRGSRFSLSMNREAWRMTLKMATLGLSMTCSLFAGWGAAESPTPLPQAHSHNDYEHDRPLHDALDRGFCSVEADVFLENGQLLVAHNVVDLRPERTLETLYLEPLRRRISANKGQVFPDGPRLTLLIDFKTDGEPTYAALAKVLATYGDLIAPPGGGEEASGAIDVVISGDRPIAMIEEDEKRQVGVDGRIADLKGQADSSLLPLISDHWPSHFTWAGEGPMPADERRKLREFSAQAHAQGRRLRFWATPDKLAVWRELRDAGVDLIGADDLDALQRFLLDAQPTR